jgi:UDP-N-acetyl-D-glucosamine dehydrogenase
MGIDIWEVVNAAATKPFGFMKFTPGPGVGGHCLPIDPAYMGWRVRTELGQPFRFVELADDINNHMPDYVVRRAGDVLNNVSRSVRGSRVLVLGVAYKPGTADVRESPSERIIELLFQRGAEVRALDPHVFGSFEPPEDYSAYDLVILVTDHEEFDYEQIAQEATLILDCRNRFVQAPHIFSL